MVAANRPGRALARCTGDPAAFLSRSWSTQPHFHRGASFADLLSFDDIDALVTTGGLRAPAFRLVKAGQTLPSASYTRSGRIGSKDVAGLCDPGKVFDLFAQGATIVLQGLHRSWEPLTRFCRDLEATLNHPVQANAYVTPPVASGLRVHADAHDVFALQTHGRKHWAVWPPLDEEGAGTPAIDRILEPGDALYLPLGTPHAARTIEEPSVHVTIGIRPVTWQSVLRHELTALLEDDAFNRPLPPGFAHDAGARQAAAAAAKQHLADLIARAASLDGHEIAAGAARRFVRDRPPVLRGQLAILLGLDDVDDELHVETRAEALWSLRVLGDRLSVELGDRTLHLPARLEPALRTLLAGGPLRVGDLGALLDPEGRKVLVQRLLREGLLVPAEAG